MEGFKVDSRSRLDVMRGSLLGIAGGLCERAATGACAGTPGLDLSEHCGSCVARYALVIDAMLEQEERKAAVKAEVEQHTPDPARSVVLAFPDFLKIQRLVQDVYEQATRRKRAADEHGLLEHDLVVIEDKSQKALDLIMKSVNQGVV